MTRLADISENQVAETQLNRGAPICGLRRWQLKRSPRQFRPGGTAHILPEIEREAIDAATKGLSDGPRRSGKSRAALDCTATA